MKILPQVIRGGAGTGVRPGPRESLPKQVLLIDARSALQMAVKTRAGDLFESPIVISNQDYRFLVFEQLKGIARTARIAQEPARRDSWAAVAVGAEIAAPIEPDKIVDILTPYPIARTRVGFTESCRRTVVAAAPSTIVALGIKSDEPATGSVYIETGKSVVATGEAFLEKPDAPIAVRYAAEHCHSNAGHLFRLADGSRDEPPLCMPETFEAAANAASRARNDVGSFSPDMIRRSRRRRNRSNTPTLNITRKPRSRRPRSAGRMPEFGRPVRELSQPDGSDNFVNGHGVNVNMTNVGIGLIEARTNPGRDELSHRQRSSRLEERLR